MKNVAIVVLYLCFLMRFSAVIATFLFLKLLLMSFHFSDILLDYQAFAVKGGAWWAVCIMGSECVCVMGSECVVMGS